MRTSLFLITGFLLLGACVLLAKLFSPHYSDASWVATTAYVVLWLIIAAFNMWVGVAQGRLFGVRGTARLSSHLWRPGSSGSRSQMEASLSSRLRARALDLMRW